MTKNNKAFFTNIEPYETQITMKVSDVKTIKHEDLIEEKPKEEYDKLLLKVYWLLKGINIEKQDDDICEMIDEIEDFI